MSAQNVSSHTREVSNRRLNRREAARHLGICVRSFDKISDQIPCSAAVPGSPVRRWRESDLDRWTESQMTDATVDQYGRVKDMTALIYSLP